MIVKVFLLLVRKELGLNQKELAEKLKVSNATISEVEAGNGKPHFEILYNLFYECNVNVNYLLSGRGNIFRLTASDIGETAIVENFPKDQAEFLEMFLGYFRESEIVRLNVMAFFKTFLLEKEVLIERDILYQKKKRSE